MSETVLHGGDLNLVVRVGDTVRRPIGPWSPAVHALLRHFEKVGFDGAPRFLGIDEEGREMLSFVEGEAALAPVPESDDVVAEIGAFLRRMHDAQAGFVMPSDARWQQLAQGTGDVVCHLDLFWTNVVFRGGHVVAVIDWDLAAPAPRLHDLASAANFWVALRDDAMCEAWGLPVDRRAQRLAALCDGYRLPRASRPALLDAVDNLNRRGFEIYHRWGRDERRPGWAELWDRDQDRYLTARRDWFTAHREEVAEWLR